MARCRIYMMHELMILRKVFSDCWGMIPINICKPNQQHLVFGAELCSLKMHSWTTDQPNTGSHMSGSLVRFGHPWVLLV